MKKVIMGDEKQTVTLDEVNSNKIYAIVRRSVIYKAHSTDRRWHFLSIEDSISRWSCEETLSDLIASEVEKGVYEFESYTDYWEWVLR